jgi:hypothetical protein
MIFRPFQGNAVTPGAPSSRVSQVLTKRHPSRQKAGCDRRSFSRKTFFKYLLRSYISIAPDFSPGTKRLPPNNSSDFSPISSPDYCQINKATRINFCLLHYSPSLTSAVTENGHFIFERDGTLFRTCKKSGKHCRHGCVSPSTLEILHFNCPGLQFGDEKTPPKQLFGLQSNIFTRLLPDQYGNPH